MVIATCSNKSRRDSLRKKPPGQGVRRRNEKSTRTVAGRAYPVGHGVGDRYSDRVEDEKAGGGGSFPTRVWAVFLDARDQAAGDRVYAR
jgi:hypothetical protein